MATAARRCALMLALVVLFLTVGLGGPPSHETGEGGPLLAERGLAPQIVVKRASAETLADANQQGTDERGYYDGTISTRARFKTH